jgi:hypothetical protein
VVAASPGQQEPTGEPYARRPETPTPPPARWVFAARTSWVAGLVLAMSSFMGWYSGSSTEGPIISVLGWNTGTLGKLVFVVGVGVVALALLRELGVEMPSNLPESMIVVALGTTGAVLVLIRVISIPDEFAGTANRAVGLWVALIASAAVIVSGLVRAGEEL